MGGRWASGSFRSLRYMGLEMVPVLLRGKDKGRPHASGEGLKVDGSGDEEDAWAEEFRELGLVSCVAYELLLPTLLEPKDVRGDRPAAMARTAAVFN